ncbi:MAG TPA: amidohydrolase family protein, partial [Phycisphaerae bacterium]|nr:amidohydrolase family protein [Phycisphaerae bacterium]
MQRMLSAVLLILFVAAPATAENPEAPLAIVGATIHESGMPTVTDGTIVIVDGRIAAAGAHVDIPPQAARLDATGLHAYPGFVDAYANLGIPQEKRSAAERELFEDTNPDTSQGPLVETRRANRRGILPQWRADEAYAPDEEDLDAFRQAGFTTALVGPRGGLVGGSSAVIDLSDLPRRRAVLLTDFAQHASFSPYEPGDYPRTPLGAIASLRQFFYDVQWYREMARRPRNLAPDARVPADPALQAAVDASIGAQALIFDAQTDVEILRALRMADEFNLRVWISDGREAFRVVDELKKRSIPVIASLDFENEPEAEVRKTADGSVYWEPKRLRDERERLWLEQVNNVQTLVAAGVDVALSTRGVDDTQEFRKKLRIAIEHGLPVDAALTALTDTPAKLLGMRNALGTLTPGALANVVLFDKPFEAKRAKVRYAFVEGHRFAYEDKPRDDKRKKDADDADDDEPDSADAPSNGLPPGVDDPHHTHAQEVAADDIGTAGEANTNGAAAPAEATEGEPVEPDWRVEIDADRHPALHTGGNVFIRNATILPISGPILKDASILVRNGRIEALGADLTPPDGIAIIEGAGLFVMPGIIDCHSHMAIDAVNEGVLSVSAEVRVGDVINPRQLQIYRALAGGVTTIHTMHGSANTIGGECVVLKLRFDTSPDAMRFKGAPRSLKFALGENVTHMNNSPRGNRFPHTRMGVESVMRQA